MAHKQSEASDTVQEDKAEVSCEVFFSMEGIFCKECSQDSPPHQISCWTSNVDIAAEKLTYTSKVYNNFESEVLTQYISYIIWHFNTLYVVTV